MCFSLLIADEIQGVLETPERVREFRVERQYIRPVFQPTPHAPKL
jgi:hypothetical protein